MKKLFLIPLMTLMCSVMAWAVEVTTLQELKDAIPSDATPTTIKLMANIDAGTTTGHVITIPSGKNVTLDLNGFTLSATVKANDRKLLVNNGNLIVVDSDPNGQGTIRNNAVSGMNGFTRFIENSANATMRLEKCKIYSNKMCINNIGTLYVGTQGGSNDDVIIESLSNGGTTTYPGAGSNDAVGMTLRTGANLIFYCGTLKSATHPALYAADGRSNVTIYDGKFLINTSIAPAWFGNDPAWSSTDMTISGGVFSTSPAAFVDQSHMSLLDQISNLYNVVEILAPREYVVYNESEIASAISNVTVNQGASMTLGANITLSQSIELPHGSNLNIPAGKTLTVQDGVVFKNEGATINNGEIVILGTGFFSKPASVTGSGQISMAGYSKDEVAGVVNYAISTPMQLQYLAYLALQSEYADKTWNIVLNTDIDMPANVNFEPINEIQGTFDGNKYSINNFTIISDETEAALFSLFKGTIQNLTMNNVNIQADGAVLCGFLKENSIVKNVTLNGTLTSKSGSACGFVNTMENVSSSLQPYGMKLATDYVWFVNCVNNVTLSTQKGWFPAAFVGTITEVNGTVGFYNCKNTANITGGQLYAGAAVGYGSSSSTARIEFINFENTGTISAPNEPLDFCGVADLVGYNMTASKVICDKIDPATWTAVWDETLGKYVAKEAGTLDNTNSTTTDWATNTTWTTDDDATNVVPNEADNVTVNSAVVVNDGTDAVAKSVAVASSLTIKDGASLTVGEDGLQIEAGATVTVEKGATLVVGADGINIADGGNLVIEATENGGSGVVLVDPAAAAADARPMASVELIPDAYKVSEGVYKHRYIGIPLYFEGAEEFAAANWQRESIQDGESVTTIAKIWNNGAWQDVSSISEFVPFKGYALSNESTHGVKYTFKGKLVGNGDGTMNFAYGFNLFANSYTAPINIQTLLNSLSNDVKATIYMFKDDKLQTVSKADFAGFRTPKFTVIPSMQAFFVLMDDGTSASETIDYAEAVFNNSLANGPLYAPARTETPDFNRVRINIAAENGASDELYLIETADYTSEFENGFDEAKFMNNGLNIYATTAYGRQATEITNDLNGTFVGVKGNGTYTLTFDELEGEEYQIRDLQTNEVVVMNEVNTYTFTVNGENEARFVVEPIYKAPTAIDNVNEAKMFINNNTLYVSGNADIMIYAANGQLVLAQPAQQTVDLSGLATGVYTVRVANQTLKFVK